MADDVVIEVAAGDDPPLARIQQAIATGYTVKVRFLGHPDEAGPHLRELWRMGALVEGTLGGRPIAFEKAPDPGPTLPVLRAADDPYAIDGGRSSVLSAAPDGIAGPWVTVAMDAGDTRRPLGPDDLDAPFDEVLAAALEALPDQPTEVDASGDAVMVTGDYAAETILLPARMREIQAQLGVPGMAVIVPVEGMLVAFPPARSAQAIALAEQAYTSGEARPIFHLPLIVADGHVQGVVTAGPASAPPPRPNTTPAIAAPAGVPSTLPAGAESERTQGDTLAWIAVALAGAGFCCGGFTALPAVALGAFALRDATNAGKPAALIAIVLGLVLTLLGCLMLVPFFAASALADAQFDEVSRALGGV